MSNKSYSPINESRSLRESYFLSEPTEEDLRPTERERLALLGLYHWRKSSEEESIPIGRHDCTEN